MSKDLILMSRYDSFECFLRCLDLSEHWLNFLKRVLKVKSCIWLCVLHLMLLWDKQYT